MLPDIAGVRSPSPKRSAHAPTDISDLFGFGGFYDPYFDKTASRSDRSGTRSRKSARMRALMWRARAFAQRKRETIVSKIQAARAKREARLRRASPVPALFGALCAVMTVFAVSLAFVGARLLFGDGLLRFERVSVPDFLGQIYEDAAFDSELFEITVDYEYDTDTPKGTVIEQSPTAGVTRRVYHGTERCRVTLTVSLGERTLTMKDYVGKPQRETLLELKNESVKFRISEKYSDTVPAGAVISTEPTAGESFSAEEVVTLVVSLGRERKFAAVPDLSGLSEVRAGEALRALGFEVGEIRYIASARPSGTVISQSVGAYSLAELGSRVDLEVSAGAGFSQKTVPELYGLTVDEARERLAEVGLVCGRIYNLQGDVQGADSTATVISQSIAAGTPISSGVVSVDIYVSSRIN